MPHGVACSRMLIGAVLLVQISTLGCKRSQVWLGRAHSAAEAAAPSGDDHSVPDDALADAAARAAADADSTPDAGGNPDAGMPSVAATSAAMAPSGGSDPSAADGGSVEAQRDAGSGGVDPTFLPTPQGPCPALVSGEIRLLDITMTLWVGPARSDPGPLLIYWHGVGSSTSEVSRLGTVVDEILDQGGMIAALAESTSEGKDTGTGTWFTGDFDVVDELVACAVAAGKIDKRRIYTGGCSTGGLTAGTMLYLRSGYLAGAQLDSGGTLLNEPLQDPQHVPALIAAHGSSSTDVVIVNYAELSAELAQRVASDGGFAVLCNHRGGHCATPARIREAQWRFLMAHPYGTSQSPYEGGLPAMFPSECRIARKP